MENKKKSFWTYALLFLIISALLYGCIALFVKYKNAAKETETIQRVYQDSLKEIKLENGKVAQMLELVTVNRNQYRNSVDSLAKLLKVKPKFIKGDDQYVYETKFDTIVKTKIVTSTKDTTYEFAYKDYWLDISGTVDDFETEIRFSSVDTINRVTYSKTNIFGRTTNRVVLWNQNPHNKLKAGYAYTEKQKKAYLTIGPSLQYDPFNNRVNLGVSVQYPLIQLKK